MAKLSRIQLLSFVLGAGLTMNGFGQVDAFRHRVKHIVVIYQENWSFDGLYGFYPGADNLTKKGGVNYKQVGCKGLADTIAFTFPLPYLEEEDKKPLPHLPMGFVSPNKPFRLDSIGTSNLDHTGDLVHRFVSEQYQINNGKMNCFAAYSDNPGLVLSYYDASRLPEGELAKRYTMCDHFFHSAFGGSYLNHMWLVAAKTPQWPIAKKKVPAAPFTLPYEQSKKKVEEGKMNGNAIIYHLSKKGYLDPKVDPAIDSSAVAYYPVNTVYSENLVPYYMKAGSEKLMPLLKDTTIADRMNEMNISWAWYAGGWDKVMDTSFCKEQSFQYHHQPFAYFERTAHSKNLQDETKLMEALKNGNGLPQVSFVKPIGRYNEHPSYASLLEGQEHVAALVKAIENSAYWNETLVIIAYDENGGRWDHVAPPKNDKDGWGPGTRVPAVLISPWSKTPVGSAPKIDNTTYETVSILKTIEVLFNLRPLTDRDRDAMPMIQGLNFKN